MCEISANFVDLHIEFFLDNTALGNVFRHIMSCVYCCEHQSHFDN